MSSDANDLPRRGFEAPRIPFDVRCVALAALGYLAVVVADAGLSQLFGGGSAVSQFVDAIAAQIGRVAFLGQGFRIAMRAVWGLEPCTLAWWELLVTATVFFAIWSFFGAALLRTAALRLSRDEPLSFAEAFAFGGRNWLSFLLAPVFVCLFAGFFWLCNMAAGAVMSLWGVGSSILALVLFPLVLISSLLAIVAALGGLIGLPLMWSGIVFEQLGTLEAVSRSFSYIFARKFHFFFGYLLVFVLMTVVLLVGSYFEGTVKESLRAGSWRADFDRMISEPPGDVGTLESEYASAESVRRRAEGIADVSNLRDARWYDWLGFIWMWLTLGLFQLGFKGYALFVFLGGTASIYQQLRRDVDGTDERTIHPPRDEDLEFDESDTPRWVGSEAEDAETEDAGTGSAGTGSAGTGSVDTGSVDTGSVDTEGTGTKGPATGSTDAGAADTKGEDTETGGPETGGPETGGPETGGAGAPEPTPGPPPSERPDAQPDPEAAPPPPDDQPERAPDPGERLADEPAPERPDEPPPASIADGETTDDEEDRPDRDPSGGADDPTR